MAFDLTTSECNRIDTFHGRCHGASRGVVQHSLVRYQCIALQWLRLHTPMKTSPSNLSFRSEEEVWGSAWGVGPSTTNDSKARQGLSARLEV
jgi:hypothetical protein